MFALWRKTPYRRQKCRKQRQEESFLKIQHQEKISIAMVRKKYTAESGENKRTYAELLSYYSRTEVLTRPQIDNPSTKRTQFREE